MFGLLERREGRAREELESWLGVLRQAQEEVTAARERAERARVAREELVQALAEESAVPAGGDADPSAVSGGLGAGMGMTSGRRCGSRAWARRRSVACTGRCSLPSRPPGSR
ncbi:hypothetical protein AB5J72_36465 [Streptomyces sp. CG1]|uniref:hypothetical protein n=1 Tax=Streptomyces sp. CG1 TaxID=1287523 RepID=UPI0034E23EC1